MKIEKEQIKEINNHISDALDQWADITLTADADEWAYQLNYTKEDLENATLIFIHVLQNIGIKNGNINFKNSEDCGKKLKEYIKDFTGIDIYELYKKQ